MIGAMIADSARLSVGYARRLLADVPGAQFARFADVDGKPVVSNHPAFILGHLSIYPCRIVRELGGDASAIEPSARYEELFSPKASCQDDPDGSLYPPMEELTERFFTAHDAAVDAVLAATETMFAQENPNEKMRSRFGTMGSMHAFYMGGHIMIHMGQLSAWRRMMGLPPA